MLYKRPDSPYYWIKLKASGRQVRRSTGTKSKRQAAVLESRLKAELWRHKNAPSQKTFEDAAVRWLESKTHKKSWDGDRIIIRWLRPHLEGLSLSEISRDKIEELRTLKSKEASDSTVNRHMALLRSILRAAALDWEWLDKVPKIPMYEEPQINIRWITPQEFERLAQELPEHLEAIARFAVATGLRAGPIKALQWSWIFGTDLRLPPGVMKNKTPLTIPLGKDARCVLETQKGKHPDYVFTYKGGIITGKLSTRAWRKAIIRADTTPLRFHDLRHTWASWHVQNGTPLEVLKELGGWKSLSMVLRYAHLAPSTLAQWANNTAKGSR